MNKIVNIHAAKTQFSKLVERAEAGEEIVIARAGKPVARLMPLDSAKPPRRFGAWRGLVEIAEDFDADLPKEVLDAFYKGPVFPPQRPRKRKR
jgi:prevent-host-death family protein